MSSGNGSNPISDGPLLGSIITIIVVMVVLTTTVNYAAAPLATETSSSSPSTLSTIAPSLTWSSSVNYPANIWTQSCVGSSGYIYCVGGLSASGVGTNAAYYAQTSSSGVSKWMNTTDYPVDIRSQSCVAASNTIYCVGGYNNTAVTDQVYYATLSSTGVGAWTATTSYPTPIWTHSCVASADGVYCVGGATSAGQGTSAVYFAPFSSSGVGRWTGVSSYPTAVRQQSCVATANDLFCIGGLDETSVYYATLIPSGLGNWTSTTGYPFTVGANLLSCSVPTAPLNNVVFCVGGHTGPNVSDAVYETKLSQSGAGQWVSSGTYPLAVWGLSCVATETALYCTGGETSSGTISDRVSFAEFTAPS